MCGQDRHAQHRWARDGKTANWPTARRSSLKKNFNIYYEIDGEEVGSALRADEYGGDEDFSWVWMPEPAAVEPQSPAVAEA